jgi:hypothetical protein
MTLHSKSQSLGSIQIPRYTSVRSGVALSLTLERRHAYAGSYCRSVNSHTFITLFVHFTSALHPEPLLAPTCAAGILSILRGEHDVV